MRRTIGLEAAVLAPALAAGLGLGRLTRAPMAVDTVVPVIACVVGGHLATAATRRLRVPLAGVVSALAGALAVTLVSVWWFVGRATVWGLPTPLAARALGRLLSSAFAVIEASPTPVVATAGVLLCAAGGAGLLAVCARALLPSELATARAGRLGLALVPSAGLFAYASLLSSQSDRLEATVGYAAAVLLCLVAYDRASSGHRLLVAGRRSATRRPVTALVVSGLAVAGALAVPLAVSPALAGMRLHALAGSGAGAGGGVGGSVSPAVAGDTLVLADDLDGEPELSSSAVLFVARSPLPTYWQVATLTGFDGLSWDPDVATLLASEGVTPLPPAPPSFPVSDTASVLTASVSIVHLQGSLLPAPPDTVSVNGRDMRIAPGIGVDRPAGAVPGTTYSVVALAAPAPASSEQGAHTAADDADLAPYLQLPPLPGSVVSLARRIVAGAHSPLAQATALVHFFDDGRFRYSLTARAGGEAALEQFLFGTRAGECQQFAGAYGVLARVDGLPTRIAVGFNAGSAIGKGVYQVTAADAHVWPEVYLGPSLGWVSMEPTPLTSGTLAAAGVVYGKSSVPGSGAPAAGVFQNPRSARDRGVGQTASPSSSTSLPRTRLAAALVGDHSTPLWPWAPAVVVVLGALVLGRHRLRDAVDAVRCRAAAPPTAVVLRWEQAVRALDRRDLGRVPVETMAEHARRVQGSLGGQGPRAGTEGNCGATAGPGSAFAELAALASLASYSGRPLSAHQAEQARRLGAQVRSSLGGRRRR